MRLHFTVAFVCGKLKKNKGAKNTMKPDLEKLREKYIKNPPEGMTSKDVRSMSDEDLLDMDYFLNDDELDDDFGEEGFYLF